MKPEQVSPTIRSVSLTAPKNNGDGTITLNFTVYSIDLDTYSGLDSNGLKAYYKLTPDKAKQDKSLTKVKTGRATVDVGQSGSYYLISYETNSLRSDTRFL